MKLIVRTRASYAIKTIGRWVDEHNTEGAGDRWLEKVFAEFERRANIGVVHAPCASMYLAKLDYRCFHYPENWTVAYKIQNDCFVIYRFVWAANIKS